SRLGARVPGYFSHINAAARIDADAVRRVEIAQSARIVAPAPPCHHIPLWRENTDPPARRSRFSFPPAGPATGTMPQCSHVREAGPIEGDLARPRHVRPFAGKRHLRTQYLNAAVLPISDENPSRCVDGDPMRYAELPRPVARLAPRAEQLPVRRK